MDLPAAGMMTARADADMLIVMPRPLPVFLLAVLLVSGPMACAPGGGPLRQDDPWANMKANMIFDRAEQYYARGDYANALVSYRAYLDDYQGLHRANDAAFRVAQSLEAMGERMEAGDVYRSVALVYNRSELSAPAFLRTGELYELEGFWTDAHWAYSRGAEYLNTEAGRTALARRDDLASRIAAQRAALEAARRPTAQNPQIAPSDTRALNAPNQPRRAWPPRGKSLWDIILGK